MVGVAGLEPVQYPLFKGKIECRAQIVRKSITFFLRKIRMSPTYFSRIRT